MVYIISRKIRVKGDELHIEPLGDFHVGSPHTDLDRIRDRVEAIRAEPDRYWIGMGDYIESIGPYRRGVVDKRWMEWLARHGLQTPLQQLDEFFKLVEPIKKKCLGLIIGNHDYTVLDPGDLKLEFENRGYIFLGPMAFIKIEVVKNGKLRRSDWIWACHGSYAGMRQGGAVNRLEDLSRKYYADVYLHAHTHAKNFWKGIRYIPQADPPKLIEKTMIYVLTGCFVREHVVNDFSYTEIRPSPRTVRLGTITVGFPINKPEVINAYD